MAKFRLSPLEINPDYEPRDSHKAPQPTGQVFDNFISRLGQMLSEGIIHVNACFAKETMNRHSAPRAQVGNATMSLPVLERFQLAKSLLPIALKHVPDKSNRIEHLTPLVRHVVAPLHELMRSTAKVAGS